MSSPAPPLYLMHGKTTHTRFEPKRHAFRYGVTLIEIDVDRLDEADAQSPLFSVDRHNLVSFDTTKRGSRGKSSLAEWARGLFRKAGIKTDQCSIRLLTFPRTEFFSFSPLSIWLLLSSDGELQGLIYEVNNTFGEQHCYVAGPELVGAPHAVEKNFHVSPFFDISGQYRFTVTNFEDQFELLIENIVNNERVHSASLKLSRKPATSLAFFRFVLLSPLSGIGVVAAIHWEALRLFIKGMRYRPKPSAPKDVFTPAEHN